MCKAIRDWENESIQKGEQNLLTKQVSCKIKKGKNISQIASELELDIPTIEAVYESAKQLVKDIA